MKFLLNFVYSRDSDSIGNAFELPHEDILVLLHVIEHTNIGAQNLAQISTVTVSRTLPEHQIQRGT